MRAEPGFSIAAIPSPRHVPEVQGFPASPA
jgi:hypothetical protein